MIFGLAEAQDVFGTSVIETLTLVITFSMALTPLALFLFDKVTALEKTEETKSFDSNYVHDEPEVIIAGYGRYGRIAARILMMQKIPFTASDHSPEHVQTALKYGYKIYYGDATRLDLLNTAGVAKAKVFLIATDDVDVSLKIAETLRHNYPDLKIFARARNRQHVFDMMKLGVEVIHRELFASSLNMAKDILSALGLETEKANNLVQRFKNHDEELLKSQYEFKDDEKLYINKTREMNLLLEHLLREDIKSGG